MTETVTVSEITAALRTIENLCTTSHWTASRRWTIEQTARELRTRLEKQHGLFTSGH